MSNYHLIRIHITSPASNDHRGQRAATDRL